MKVFARIFVLFLTFFVLASSVAQAQDKPKGWSRKAKGAAVGGVGGALVGGLVGGKTGAGAGVVGGGAVGRNQDKKKDPARYYNYRNKK